MPFVYRRPRIAGRKYIRRRIVRKRSSMPMRQVRSLVPKLTNTIKIVRKGVTAHVYNNAAGTDFATNSTWLTIGSKQAVASSLPNYYNLGFSAKFSVADMYNWAELQYC